jgi:hypothetical protein
MSSTTPQHTPPLPCERCGETAPWWVDSYQTLGHWIQALRSRLAGGLLDHLPPLDLGHGNARFALAITVSTMLADLDHLAGLATTVLDRQGRLLMLLGDFGRLRQVIG